MFTDSLTSEVKFERHFLLKKGYLLSYVFSQEETALSNKLVAINFFQNV